MKNAFFKTAALSLVVSGLMACANHSPAPAVPAAEKAAPVASANNDDLYEVHEDGRIYIFDSEELYRDFVKLGETPFVLARIGEGPNGETIKFGLTSKDKKKKSGIASIDMYDGTLKPADNFYGELRMEGRIYVFSTLDDMISVRKTGEAVFRYTDIGSGPAGETVVYVLNKSNKKHKPEALMSAFKKHYNM